MNPLIMRTSWRLNGSRYVLFSSKFYLYKYAINILRYPIQSNTTIILKCLFDRLLFSKLTTKNNKIKILLNTFNCTLPIIFN